MERDLVERARAGDREAFEVLVRSKVGTMYHTAVAILGHRADADDATQEAFISAWRRLDDLRDPDRFDAWLTRILVNACRSAIRRRTRRQVREVAARDDWTERARIDQAAVREPAFDESTAEADRFDRAFERLSNDDRALLVLHHLEERSVAEIGVRLGIPTGTVKSRLYRARGALERALREAT
jgi:RNA polymerase sigma-70 factor (ECF subfamily)